MTPVAWILTESGGVIADKGYQGCGYVTPRKKPKGGELSVSDKRENKNISRLRAPVERAMAHLKAWRILHTDYPEAATHLPDLLPGIDRLVLLLPRLSVLSRVSDKTHERYKATRKARAQGKVDRDEHAPKIPGL